MFIINEKERKICKNGLVSVLTIFYVEYEKSADNLFKMGGRYKTDFKRYADEVRAVLSGSGYRPVAS